MFTAFRDLPYSEFKSLANAIKDSAEWSELAEKKANWLSKCRLIYNEDCGKSSIIERKPEAYTSSVISGLTQYSKAST